MYSDTQKPVISTHTIRLVIGLIAITLPFLTSWLAGDPPLKSISASYYVTSSDWPRNIFVGFLISISALFLAYNGTNKTEFYLSKVGSVASFLIATFPEQGSTSTVHGIASVIMFSILAILCYQFNKSALSIYKSNPAKFPQAKTRAHIYKVCGLVIIVSMVLVAIKFPPIARLTFYCESAGLLAFGIAWLVASKIIPVNAITHPEEQVSLFSFSSESKH